MNPELETIIVFALSGILMIMMIIEEIRHPYDCKLSPDEIYHERLKQEEEN